MTEPINLTSQNVFLLSQKAIFPWTSMGLGVLLHSQLSSSGGLETKGRFKELHIG